MKHLIIINNKAGNPEEKAAILKTAKKEFKDLDYEIYETTGPRSVIPYLKEYLKKNSEDTVRVYACGGDGTVHEVVNGMIDFKNAELAILPVGTGNDFVKIYGVTNETAKDYRSFKPLIKGTPIDIDISKVEGDTLKEPWYSINVVNFGFDAIVGAKGNINKAKGKKDPYGAAAIVPAILGGRFNKITVKADGKAMNNGRLLLSSIAQGQVVGSKYHASPKSKNDDGLLDVVVMKCMSLARLMIKYFDKYEKGLYMDYPNLMKKISYERCKVAEVIAPKEIDLCVDGEMTRGKYFKVTCMAKALKLVPPSLK